MGFGTELEGEYGVGAEVVSIMEIELEDQSLPIDEGEPQKGDDNSSLNDYSVKNKLDFLEKWPFKWQIPLGSDAEDFRIKEGDTYTLHHHRMSMSKGYTLEQLAQDTFTFLLHRAPNYTKTAEHNKSFLYDAYQVQLPVIVGEFSGVNDRGEGIKELCAVTIIEDKVCMFEMYYMANGADIDSMIETLLDNINDKQ